MGRHTKQPKPSDIRKCELCGKWITGKVAWSIHRRSHNLYPGEGNRGRKYTPSPLSKPGYRAQEG